MFARIARGTDRKRALSGSAKKDSNERQPFSLEALRA
jgi:hypothetical protein